MKLFSRVLTILGVLSFGMFFAAPTVSAQWGSCPVPQANQCGTGANNGFRCQSVSRGLCVLNGAPMSGSGTTVRKENVVNTESDCSVWANGEAVRLINTVKDSDGNALFAGYRFSSSFATECACRWVSDASCSSISSGGETTINNGGGGSGGSGTGGSSSGNGTGGGGETIVSQPAVCTHQNLIPSPPNFTMPQQGGRITRGVSQNLTWSVGGTPAMTKYWLEIYPSKNPAIDLTYLDYVAPSRSMAGSTFSDPSLGTAVYHPGFAFDNETFLYHNYGYTNNLQGVNTTWASARQGSAVNNTEWLGFDFGAGNEKTIGSVSIQQFANVNSQVSRVAVQGSNDAKSWKSIESFSLTKDGTNRAQTFTIRESNRASYRYWRVLAQSGVASDYSWAVQNLEFRGTDIVNALKATMSPMQYAFANPSAENYYVRVAGSRPGNCYEQWSDWSQPRLFSTVATAATAVPTPVATVRPTATPTPRPTAIATPVVTPVATVRPTATPTAAPAVLTCTGLTAAPGAPKLDETIQFTCKPVASAQRYEFQIGRSVQLRNPNYQFQALSPQTASSNVSIRYPVTQAGKYVAQCRACAGNVCGNWENATGANR